MTADTANPTAQTAFTPGSYKLPPLILHPFSDAAGPNSVAASSRASLMMQGFLPTGNSTQDDLDRTFADGRFAEMRMLFYVGRDLTRWIEQCMDCVRRHSGGVPSNIQPQSFAAFLIDATPAHVKDKLSKWGVNDYKTIFSRSIGLNTIFSTVPDRTTLTEEFVRNYYKYADQVFTTFQTQGAYAQLDCAHWQFEVYSSGEYARMLERAWAE